MKRRSTRHLSFKKKVDLAVQDAIHGVVANLEVMHK
jgi:hypothetical protein